MTHKSGQAQLAKQIYQKISSISCARGLFKITFLYSAFIFYYIKIDIGSLVPGHLWTVSNFLWRKNLFDFVLICKSFTVMQAFRQKLKGKRKP